MSKPTVAQRRRAETWRQMCDELVTLAQRLREQGPALITRASIPLADGYPTSASGAVRSPGRSARARDEDDDDEGPVDDGVGRPVENLVIAMIDAGGSLRDPVLEAVANMRTALAQALEAARRADDSRRAAGHVPSSETPEARAEAPGCVNCDRFDIYSVAVKAGRDWACYQYRRRHGRDAPESIVRARLENSTPRAIARDFPQDINERTAS